MSSPEFSIPESEIGAMQKAAEAQQMSPGVEVQGVEPNPGRMNEGAALDDFSEWLWQQNQGDQARLQPEVAKAMHGLIADIFYKSRQRRWSEHDVVAKLNELVEANERKRAQMQAGIPGGDHWSTRLPSVAENRKATKQTIQPIIDDLVSEGDKLHFLRQSYLDFLRTEGAYSVEEGK